MKRLHFIVVILFFANTHCAFTQNITDANDSFYHLSMPGGIDQNSINQFVQDSKGQMWIATKDGLIRYNGKKLAVYKSDPDNANSIAHNFVTAIAIDNQDRLWVGTHKGLSVYRQEKDDFEMLFPDIFLDEDVRSLSMDSKGNLWILNALKNQLYKYSIATNTLEQLVDDNLVDKKGKVAMEWMLTTKDDRLFFINKEKGLVEYFQDTNTFKRYDFEDKVYYSLFIQDKRDKDLFWVTTHKGYFFSYNIKTQKQTKFIINKELTNYGLRCFQSGIFEDDKNNIWITTWFYGTFKLLPNRKSIQHYLPDKYDKQAISNSISTAPYQDKAGYMWFGAEYNGVDILKKNKKFYILPDVKEKKGMLPAKNFLSLSKDYQNRVWIGAEGGLYYFNKNTLKTTDLTKGFLKGAKRFFEIYNDSKNRLWFGTDKGLYIYDTNDEHITHLTYDKDNYQGLLGNYISEIYEDKVGNMWIGYFNKGISKYNPTTKKFYHFTPDEEDPNSISYKYISAIFEDSNHKIWIGTPDGLNRFNEDAGNFTVFKNDKNNPNSIGSSAINSIVEIDNTIWIATQGGGLNKFNPKTNSFKKYTKEDGLPSNNIEALLIDSHNSLWFSTTKNIIRYKLKEDSFTIYTTTDGLENRVYIVNMGWQDLKFTGNFAYKDKKDFLYFGGSSGLVFFHPDSLQQNNYKAKLFIESLKTSGKEIKLPVDKVQLQPDENQLEIDFTLLNLIQPEKNKYAWMLKPYDATWQSSGTNSKAEYFNLKPGDYQLFYKAANNDMVWTEVSKPLQISILPRFYQTKLFYLLLILFASLIFIGFLSYRWYLKRKLQRQKKLLRYKTSSLAEEKAKSINKKLIELLQKEPIYLESDLSLYSLAEKIQVKPHYLSQVINQYHQRNFQDFINLYRIEKAKKLLLKTKLKIEAVAYDSGFNSISTFYTAFKKEIGMTPSSYRKNN